MQLYFGTGASNGTKPTSLEIPVSNDGTRFETLVSLSAMPTVPSSSGPSAVLNNCIYSGKMAVEARSESTTKGVRRILVKVELPYASVKRCACGQSSTPAENKSNYTIDGARSGDTLSAHLVFTLPRGLGEDLQMTGATQTAALNQIVLVQNLLVSILRQSGVELLNSDAQLSDGSGGTGASPSGAASLQLALTGPTAPLGSNIICNLYNNASSSATPEDVANALPDVTSIIQRGAALLKPILSGGRYGVGSN
nr:MAG: hypothetical protein 2 [Leviviridae sp.]